MEVCVVREVDERQSARWTSKGAESVEAYRTEDCRGRRGVCAQSAGPRGEPDLLALVGCKLESDFVDAEILVQCPEMVSSVAGGCSERVEAKGRTQGRRLLIRATAVTPSSSAGRPPVPSSREIEKVGNATAAKSARGNTRTLG